VASLPLAAGAWVIHAKLVMNGPSTSGVMVCQLLAGTTVLDTASLSSGSSAGSVSQGQMELMSATTFTAPTGVTVSCYDDGGSSDGFASQQQILAIKVGTATTTHVNF
jgi:hypothetical protein